MLIHMTKLPFVWKAFKDLWLSLWSKKLNSSRQRYKSPDEHPFFPQCLPDPILPPIQYPQVLHHCANFININKKVWNLYFKHLLPRLAESGDDGNCGSAALCDTMCSQILSKRIHIRIFVAEAKCSENPAAYETAIREQDGAELMRLLTYETVEEVVKKRVEIKARIFSQDITINNPETGGDPSYKINPSLVAKLYGERIVPLTKEVQIVYLRGRLD